MPAPNEEPMHHIQHRTVQEQNHPSTVVNQQQQAHPYLQRRVQHHQKDNKTFVDSLEPSRVATAQSKKSTSPLNRDLADFGVVAPGIPERIPEKETHKKDIVVDFDQTTPTILPPQSHLNEGDQSTKNTKKPWNASTSLNQVFPP